MSDHEDKLVRLRAALRRHDVSRPLSIKKKAVAHSVPRRHDQTREDDKIDISDFDEILEIDPVTMTCVAEPGVTFVDLVAATLPLGLAPIVVPELETITVGGAVSGCSLESMSFKYGGFHDTCLEYEVTTAKGDVLRCAPGDLVFEMMHGSFGTLGILTKLRFKLIPAKPFVHVVYETYPTLRDYKAAIWRRFEGQDVDFMDGMIHSPTQYVLSLGTFVDEAPYTSRYDWMKVYYKSTAERPDDFLATRDYFFRYDAGVTNVHPKSTIGRFLFGKALHSATLLRAAHQLTFLLPASRPNVTVDLFVPFSRVDAFMQWYEGNLDHFPLWCVPYRKRDYPWVADGYLDGVDDELFLDLAIYGAKQRSGHNEYKEIEDELLEVRGIKTLISHNFFDEDTFWRIWNKPNYEAVKRITDPDNVLRDLYTKMCRATQG